MSLENDDLPKWKNGVSLDYDFNRGFSEMSVSNICRLRDLFENTTKKKLCFSRSMAVQTFELCIVPFDCGFESTMHELFHWQFATKKERRFENLLLFDEEDTEPQIGKYPDGRIDKVHPTDALRSRTLLIEHAVMWAEIEVFKMMSLDKIYKSHKTNPWTGELDSPKPVQPYWYKSNMPFIEEVANAAERDLQSWRVHQARV